MDHCLALDEKRLSECSQNLVKLLLELSNNLTPMNQQMINVSFLSLINHPRGKTVEEVSEFIKDKKDEESHQTSFLTKMVNANLPQYFDKTHV